MLCFVWELCTLHNGHNSLQLTVGFRFRFSLCVCLSLAFCVFFCCSLDCFFLLLVFVVLGLVFSVLCQEWLERMSPKLPILCRVGHKTFTQSINSALRHHCLGDTERVSSLYKTCSSIHFILMIKKVNGLILPHHFFRKWFCICVTWLGDWTAFKTTFLNFCFVFMMSHKPHKWL